MMAHPVRHEPCMQLVLAVCGPKFTKFCRYVFAVEVFFQFTYSAFRPQSRRYLSLSRGVVA